MVLFSREFRQQRERGGIFKTCNKISQTPKFCPRHMFLLAKPKVCYSLEHIQAYVRAELKGKHKETNQAYDRKHQYKQTTKHKLSEEERTDKENNCTLFRAGVVILNI